MWNWTISSEQYKNFSRMKLESRIPTHSSTGEINGLDVKIILTYEMLCEIAPFQLSSIETFHV
jgi:hypothetical protein